MNDCQCGCDEGDHGNGFFRRCLACDYCLDYEPRTFEPLSTSKHPTQPCTECPFRRTSAAGWIGAHEAPHEITDIVIADQKFPCHKVVNKLEDDGADFETAVNAASYCVGSLIMMNNTNKISRNSFVHDLQKRIGKSDDVFANAREFISHHEAGQRLLRGQSKKKARKR